MNAPCEWAEWLEEPCGRASRFIVETDGPMMVRGRRAEVCEGHLARMIPWLLEVARPANLPQDEVRAIVTVRWEGP